MLLEKSKSKANNNRHWFLLSPISPRDNKLTHWDSDSSREIFTVLSDDFHMPCLKTNWKDLPTYKRSDNVNTDIYFQSCTCHCPYYRAN